MLVAGSAVAIGPVRRAVLQRAGRLLVAADAAHPADLLTMDVMTTPYAAFHPDDWWRSRTTLREGLVELQKLVLNGVQHPF